MNLRPLFAILLLGLACASFAQEQAFTNRATELKDRGDAAATTVKALPENTEVKVLARAGGWTRVDAGGQQGWVRVFHLRFPAVAEPGSSASGTLSSMTSALGFGRQRSQSATIATTGVRGLSQEDLKNASPDEAELRRMQSYRADQASAERFAREGKLATVNVDTPEGGRR
ncbi:MAG TPA: hypothetical protein VM073_08380 [Usitatibacter sp.]|nr:hypothetical protein [Usitatibacter sp.]